MPIKIHPSVRNLSRKPGRTAALVILSLVLCFTVTAGSLIINGLRGGLVSLETRLGADIMVVPYQASTKADLKGMVLQGNPGYFYMDRSVTDKVSSLDGVGQVSEQFFLATASASCCSYAVQIIGFEPETDFTIQPWVQSSFKGDLDYMEILVGNSLNAFPGDTLTFYGSDCKVAAKLEKTGTYLDTAVYANEETIKTLISSAKEKQIFDFGNVDPDAIVSCVLVNVADGYSVEEVLNDINIHVRKVEAVQTQNMIEDVSRQLTGVSDVVSGLIVVVWILALIILALAFTMISNERKKEFAVLRAIGASRGYVVKMILKETLLVNIIGCACGAALGLLTTVLFSGFIESSLKLPFLLPGAAGMAILAIAAMAVSIIAGTVSSAVCALRISRMDTALILRGEN